MPLPSEVEVVMGASYRTCYGPDPNPNNRLYHIRGIVDDQVAVRTWVPRKQCWSYSFVPHYYFLQCLQNKTFVYKGASNANSS